MGSVETAHDYEADLDLLEQDVVNTVGEAYRSLVVDNVLAVPDPSTRELSSSSEPLARSRHEEMLANDHCRQIRR